MNIRIYYRLSDKGRPLDKPDFINLKQCLSNFIRHFPREKMIVMADNVNDETYDYLCNLFQPDQIERTTLGNSKGFAYLMNKCVSQCSDDEIIYLVEDDYIHAQGAMKILEEGMEIADYVTLYDNPDKYNDHGPNPYIRGGGEKSKVFLTESCHWKLTNSTCLTFAGRASTLKKDLKVFVSGTTKRKRPDDFRIWRKLIGFKRRKLISPIPGYCTHGLNGYLAPLRDWAREA